MLDIIPWIQETGFKGLIGDIGVAFSTEIGAGTSLFLEGKQHNIKAWAKSVREWWRRTEKGRGMLTTLVKGVAIELRGEKKSQQIDE